MEGKAMNRFVQETREATWPRTARETVAKLREELRTTRKTITHRFANGVAVEISLTEPKPKKKP